MSEDRVKVLRGTDGELALYLLDDESGHWLPQLSILRRVVWFQSWFAYELRFHRRWLPKRVRVYYVEFTDESGHADFAAYEIRELWVEILKQLAAAGFVAAGVPPRTEDVRGLRRGFVEASAP